MTQYNNKKVKVLQIMHGLAPGGIESFVLNLYENIDKSNLDISFALACEGKQHHEDRVIANGGTIYRTSDLNGIKNIVKHFFILLKLLKKEGPFDVVHSHIDFFNGVNLLAAFIAGVPHRICHIHCAGNSANASKEKSSIFIKVYRFIMKSLINIFSTEKLGCSLEANRYMYGRNTSDSKVIYNGIDIEKFNSNRYKDISINDIEVDKSKLNFITIGKICESKNSIFIINVIKELSKIREDIHLYWVGKGILEEDIKSLIKKYNLEAKVTLLGTRYDIPEILSKMDFMIFPSKWEGLGMVLIEAQASNIPCFISDRIPKEANLGLCTQISLNEDAKEWAKKISMYIDNNSYNNSIDHRKLYEFDARNISFIMKQIYLKKQKNIKSS